MEKIDIKNTVESQANSLENQSILLFGRLSNPKIKNQVIELFLKNEQEKEGQTVLFGKKDENGKYLLDESGNQIFEEKKYVPKTRDEIEEEYETRLGAIMNDTEFDYSDEISYGGIFDSREKISLGHKMNGKSMDTRMLSIVEAHEKGHTVRQYHGEFFDNYFAQGFDFSSSGILKDRESVDHILSFMQNKDLSSEDKIRIFMGYISSAPEIAERMSQLKGYFGMRSDEEFTKEHLYLAKENYIKDTGFDNYMKYFFESITPDKEEKFLWLINNSGI